MKKNILIITFAIFLFITYNFIAKMYIIPSPSMSPTYKIGDYFIGKKSEYGIKIPRLFMTNILLFPDINKNNYLMKFKNPKYKDIIIFKQPITKETYIKRIIAKPGDEILLHPNNNIYIHFKKEKMNKIYSLKNETLKYKNQKWIKNPFKKEIKEIHYTKKQKKETYQKINKIYQNPHTNKKINYYLKYDKEKKYYIYKVKSEEYIVLGDNRDNSFDGRFFGPIKFKDIEAKASTILFNVLNKK